VCDEFITGHCSGQLEEVTTFALNLWPWILHSEAL